MLRKLLGLLHATTAFSFLSAGVILTNSNEEVTFRGLGPTNPTKLEISFGDCNSAGCVLTGDASGSVTIMGTTYELEEYELTSEGPIVAEKESDGHFRCPGGVEIHIVFNMSKGPPLPRPPGKFISLGNDDHNPYNKDPKKTVTRFQMNFSQIGGPPNEPLSAVTDTGGNINDLLGTTNSLSGTIIPEPVTFLMVGCALVPLLILRSARSGARPRNW